MIGKILKAARKKPCSCTVGKKCPACKSKTVIKPYVYVEEPRRLPAPVSITYFNQTPHTVQFSKNPRRWRIKKQQTYDPPPKRQTFICRWYRRRKALRQLKLEYKKEQEVLKQKRRDEFEKERIRDFVRHEQKRRQELEQYEQKRKRDLEQYEQKLKQTLATPEPRPVPVWKPTPEPKPAPVFVPAPVPKPVSKPVPVKITYEPPPAKFKKIKNTTKIKEKYANVKPRGKSKYVSVKRKSRRYSMSTRFVNFCYKVCCQFYCYLTCIVIIAFTILFIV